MNSPAARIGYARVSTADQNLDAQLAALQTARCTMVRTETGDGATLAGDTFRLEDIEAFGRQIPDPRHEPAPVPVRHPVP